MPGPNILRLRPVGDRHKDPIYPLLDQRLFGYGGFFPNFRRVGGFRKRIPFGEGLGCLGGQRKAGAAVGALSLGGGWLALTTGRQHRPDHGRTLVRPWFDSGQSNMQ
jgi:hypothetical protein